METLRDFAPGTSKEAGSSSDEPSQKPLQHVLTEDERNGEQRDRRYLVRKPQALQYFHQGVLKKAQDKERVAGKFELFLDLLYVALVANFADKLSEEPTGINLVTFLLTFTPAWHAWADLKELNNNYYTDDIPNRLDILWIMALLILYGNNANFVAEEISGLRITTGTYMVIRFSQVSFFAYNSVGSQIHRLQTAMYFAIELIVFCILIPLYFENVSGRAKITVTVLAIFLEQINYMISFGPWVGRWLNLEYRTAIDIDHENDRYTAFTIIVLGEFTYAILVGSPAAGGLNLNYLRAVWTLVIAFCFNSMYIYMDGALQNTHPARHSVWTAFAWLMVHLPMSAGLLIGGHVSASATVDKDLTAGQRWLWGGGLSVSFLTLFIMSWLFHDDDPKGATLLPKYLRTLPRLAATLIFALLPLTTTEELSDTSLISIGAGISAAIVIWETVGSLEKGACMFEDWRPGNGEEPAGVL